MSTLAKADPKSLRQNVPAYTAWTWMVANADGGFGSAPKPAEAKK